MVEVRHGWRILGLTIRTVLLLVLIFGGLVAALSLTPRPGTRAELRAAAAADRVSLLEYDEQAGAIQRIRWAQGTLIWREIGPEALLAKQPAYTRADLRGDLGRSRIRATEPDDSDRVELVPSWVGKVPAAVGGVWVIGAWVLAFLIMLGSTPRLGNRWAWLWLFTVGQTGALLFLLLEPRPLWFEAGRRPAPRERLGGVRGFLLAIGVGLLSAGLTLSAGALLNLVGG
ncbi:hypothetical protein [Streptosporangium amethystogenes]|uniref:hypothetical protein n=1 Tax=Streptosporangium amethystogenes TaxID=2002 RepID=UPI0012FBFFF5|nr:hypothetical protein [Streptosporangium amethystogenes]